MASFHVWINIGKPASRSRSLVLMAAANCCGSRLVRTTSRVSLAGDCRIGRNMAGCGSSVSFVYFPSPTTPTTCVRVPSRFFRYRPTALNAEPKILRANSPFTSPTRGKLLSSCHEKPLPASKLVPEVSKNWAVCTRACARTASPEQESGQFQANLVHGP